MKRVLFLFLFCLLYGAGSAGAKEFSPWLLEGLTPDERAAQEALTPVGAPPRTDIFLAPACPRCRELWLSMIGIPEFRNWIIASDSPNIHLLPNQASDVDSVLILENLRERDPVASSDFLTFLYLLPEKNIPWSEHPARIRAWLAARNLQTADDIRKDSLHANWLIDKYNDALGHARSLNMPPLPAIATENVFNRDPGNARDVLLSALAKRSGKDKKELEKRWEENSAAVRRALNERDLPK